MFIKDLSIIPRNIKDIIIVDNLPESYLHHPDNGLPIPSWVGDPEDEAFDKMLTILQILKRADDVRPLIRECVTNDKISLYRLYEMTEEQRDYSPRSRSINLANDFKQGATTLWGYSERDSTKDNSRVNQSDLDYQENSLNGATQRYNRRSSMVRVSQDLSIGDYATHDPLCDLKYKVRIMGVLDGFSQKL